MLFLLIFIIFLAFATYGLEWLIQQPGSLTLEFAGHHLEASIPVVVGDRKSTVTGGSLISSWPNPGDDLGGGWRAARCVRGGTGSGR